MRVGVGEFEDLLGSSECGDGGVVEIMNYRESRNCSVQIMEIEGKVG